jgi:hypothetical protein
MTFGQIYAKCRQWNLDMEAGGFTPEESLKLFGWHLTAEKDVEGWTGLLLIPAKQIETAPHHEMP